MKTTCICAATIVSLALLGCQSEPTRIGGPPPLKPEARPFFYPFKTDSPPCTGRKCTVDVTPSACPFGNLFGPCGGSAQWDVLHLDRNNTNAPKIVWKLPDGYRFCAAQGDGVFLKLPDDSQFQDMFPIDNPDDDTPSTQKCKQKNHKHYHWRALNSDHGKQYGYSIIFHDANGYFYYIDPWISND